MKKLIATACALVALALPAGPAAAADDTDAWWGRKPCQWGEIGTIVWHDTPATEYEEIRLCVPRIYPQATTAGDKTDPAGPIVHTEECPPGYIGRTVYVADRGVLWGCYIRQP